MNERGQIFTLDMFFAITLIVLMVSYSGLALEQARKQADTYALRYSLERTANDAADLLVKTFGSPSRWENDLKVLETLGLVEENEGNPIPNTLSIAKLGLLRDLCREANWTAQKNENAVKSFKALFGGSENFEIKIYDENDENMWSIRPSWDVLGTSGSENSLDVVVVKRLIVKRRPGSTRGDERGLQHLVAVQSGKEYFLNFWVYPGELDLFDWYFLLRPSGRTNPGITVWVNRTFGGPDFNFPPIAETLFKLRYHGTDYVSIPLTDVENNGQPNNFIMVKVTGNPKDWVDVFIIILPRCSPTELAYDAPDTLPATLEVKLWR